MKKHFCVFIAVLALVSARAQPNSSGRNAWNGTITYIWRHGVTAPGLSAQSEMRLTADVIDGKAVTKASEKVMRRENKGGGCTITWDGYAEGTDSAFFDPYIDEEEKVCTIEMPMPVMKGKKQVNEAGCGGENKAEFMGMGDVALLVENIKLGNDPDVLAGDSVQKNVVRNGAETINEEFIISWSFTRGPAEVELLVRPVQYQQWLPKPGSSETTPGSVLAVELKLQAKGGGTPKVKAKAFELELQGTSREPGIALNAPIEISGSPAFDMAFASGEGQSPERQGQELRFAPGDGMSAIIQVQAFDGGAYANLVVSAVLQNGRRIQGRLENEKTPGPISLPRRKAGSFIAEAWLAQHNVPNDTWDAEKSPGNNNVGDGLTAYEEYRGVFSEGRYRRLSPEKKELGVRIDPRDKALFAEGLRLFAQSAGIEVIPLHAQELPKSRQWNVNAATAHVTNQHALILVNDQIGVAGRNEPAEILNKTPRLSNRIVVDVTQLQQEYTAQKQVLDANKIPMPFTLAESIAVTVAHELAHGVGVNHHGPPSDEPEKNVGTATPTTFRIYTSTGEEKTDRPFSINKYIGVSGNDASGDAMCIMAYMLSYNWVVHAPKPGELHYYKLPVLPVGNRFCTSDKGTGINANGKYFGDATTGNCMGRLRVRDEQ